MRPIRKTAVIDIGSNSCRLVIYECLGNSVLPYFNEKTMAGLGRGLSDTGCLSEPGQRLALETMRRFRAIIEGLGIVHAYAVATAAVREASDGPDFRAAAESALGVPIRVLSGAEEGRLSAAGVAYGLGQPTGWIADLGGTSLELQAVGSPSPVGETYPLGPLACEPLRTASLSKQRAHIKSTLSSSQYLNQSGPLFLVGGGWRNLAQVDMLLTGYPLRVVHAYRLSLDTVQRVLDQLERAAHKPKVKSALMAVSKKRYDTLKHTALVLETLLTESGLQSATVSAYGLRDGVIADAEALDVRQGLYDAIPHQLHLSPQAKAFGEKAFAFAQPLFSGVTQDDTILRATSLMVEAGARLHPDHRAKLVFEQILRAPLPWLTHEQRIFAALSIAVRNSFKFSIPDALAEHVSPETVRQARIFGTVLRLASVYAGRSAHLLKTAQLELQSDKLILKVQQSDLNLVSATVQRRLTQLAGLFDRNGVILYVDGPHDTADSGSTTQTI